MQTKKQSFKEALINVAVGYLISLASLFILFPIFGIESSPGKNVMITLYFTAISILRSYLLRRYFNKKHLVTYPSKKAFKLHCFNCEVDMPVMQNKDQELFCSNCGLKHVNS